MAKFKINTKEKYIILTPKQALFNANMADSISHLFQKEHAVDTLSIIFNLLDIRSTDQDGLKYLLEIHQLIADNNLSFVIVASPDLLIELKQKGLHHQMNITPTLQEAIDIVMMEDLQRELNAEDE